MKTLEAELDDLIEFAAQPAPKPPEVRRLTMAHVEAATCFCGGHIREISISSIYRDFAARRKRLFQCQMCARDIFVDPA